MNVWFIIDDVFVIEIVIFIERYDFFRRYYVLIYGIINFDYFVMFMIIFEIVDYVDIIIYFYVMN